MPKPKKAGRAKKPAPKAKPSSKAKARPKPSKAVSKPAPKPKPKPKPAPKPKPKSATIVAVSAKTGRPIKSPRKGAAVKFAIQDGKKLHPLETKYAQAYSKKDEVALQKILDKTGPKNFVVYEHKTKEADRDLQGKIKKRKDKKGAIKTVFKTKIGGHSKKQEERQVLFHKKRGKLLRTQHQHFFAKRKKRDLVDEKLLKVLQVDTQNKAVFSEEIHLQGNTIYESLRGLTLSTTGAGLKRIGADSIFVEGTMRLYRGKEKVFVRTFAMPALLDLSHFREALAKHMRRVLSDMGYRFTSLVDLQAFNDENEEKSISGNVFYMGKFGRGPVTKLAPIRPETPAVFENPIDSRFELGTDNRLVSGGEVKGAGMKLSCSFRITAYSEKLYRKVSGRIGGAARRKTPKKGRK